jgi:tRNA threonylcarbamoyl adenosine modification protein YeaZ/ribosomal-protein-alanine acetyltransferase
MTISLVIDTSTHRTSVGIVEDGLLRFEKHHDDPLAHGEVLPPLVAQAIAHFSQVDEVVIAMGPGPFTGLRVGISFGQSFALARNIPWRGTSSLDAIAAECSGEDFIVSIDARRKEIFWNRYHGGVRQGAELVTSPLSLPAGVEHFADRCPSVLALAGLVQDIGEPIYVRRPDAYPAPKDVKFRAITPMDLVEVYAIEKDSYQHDPWSMGQIKEEVAGKSRYYIVAEKDGKVIGYAGALKRGDSTDVMTLTVAQAHRRLGIGRELLRRLIDWARTQKTPSMMLEVRAGNDEAIPLYESFGFVAISRRDNYYGPGMTAIIMKKELAK